MGQPQTNIFERLPMLATALALAAIVAVIGLARAYGVRPDVSLPRQQALAERQLKFEDGAQGSVIVRDAKTDALIHSFASGEGTFVRAALRALVNDRKKKGISTEDDFRLELHAGSQLFLVDEASGRTLSLNAFGPSNSAAFAVFMSNQKGEGL